MTKDAFILIVVVLYSRAAASSKTIAGLTQAFREDPALLDDFGLLLWDNSPSGVGNAGLPFPSHYHHAPRNEGVAGAYNGAARQAREQGAQWLLLLDDDTSVTIEFLNGMRRHAREMESDGRVAAVVPFLHARGFVLSPRLWRIGRHVPLSRPASAYTERRSIFAANSGTLMRVDALQEIGGYSPRFWLDYSDIYVFHMLHQRGFGVRIAGELALEHEVAMLDYDTRMSPSRYVTYLAAESDYLDLYRGWAERLLHLGRLTVRSVRQRRFADAAFSRMTRQELWRRLRTPRMVRLRVRDQDSR